MTVIRILLALLSLSVLPVASYASSTVEPSYQLQIDEDVANTPADPWTSTLSREEQFRAISEGLREIEELEKNAPDSQELALAKDNVLAAILTLWKKTTENAVKLSGWRNLFNNLLHCVPIPSQINDVLKRQLDQLALYLGVSAFATGCTAVCLTSPATVACCAASSALSACGGSYAYLASHVDELKNLVCAEAESHTEQIVAQAEFLKKQLRVQMGSQIDDV